MSIYEEFGVKPIINLWGTATRLGGALMPNEVIEAMSEASKESVLIDELQAAASKFIASITGAEAGYVTCGAASGLALASAACLAGLDVSKMERLPNTNGMPNQIIMARDQRCGYDHAIRAAGSEIVEVGYNESLTGANRLVEGWEYEAAISDKTVGIAYIAYTWNQSKEKHFREVVDVAKRHRLPIIVDAAAAVPPIENLKIFISLGADLVAYSGGKAIRGPQNTGILCGRHDLIASAALQHLDAGGFSHLWEPPETLIPKARILGQPRQGLCRPQKVNKEAIIALLVRLRSLDKERTLSEAKRMELLLEKIIEHIDDIPYVTTTISHKAGEGSGAIPQLEIGFDDRGSKVIDIGQIVLNLRNGNPRLWVNEKDLNKNSLLVTAINLNEELAKIVGTRLREVFLL